MAAGARDSEHYSAAVPNRRVVAAPDKFKGSLSAREVAEAIGHACWELGIECAEVPMADGGDGLLDVLGGANRTSTVTGPLGDPVVAPWRMSGGTAVIEMARASGLALVGGAEHNDPMAATTTGTGELIDHALDAGARRIVVGLGGSASTDGGFGAIRSINAIARLRNVELLAACDVTTKFRDAAAVYAPQKGATPAQVRMLGGRLDRLTQMFLDDFDTDVTDVDGGGAAGGLGGALAALGATLLPGFELVADELDLYDHLEGADVVVTGEGRLDDTSFRGKVVGGVHAIAREAGVATAAIVGSVDDRFDLSAHPDLTVVSLVAEFGEVMAFDEPKRSVERAARSLLAPH
jgi:glycerate kinase